MYFEHWTPTESIYWTPTRATLVRGSLEWHGAYNVGWSWTIRFTDDDGHAELRRYRTNQARSGLFCGDRQIEGTSQFALSRQYDKARRQIHQYFKPDHS